MSDKDLLTDIYSKINKLSEFVGEVKASLVTLDKLKEDVIDLKVYILQNKKEIEAVNSRLDHLDDKAKLLSKEYKTELLDIKGSVQDVQSEVIETEKELRT